MTLSEILKAKTATFTPQPVGLRLARSVIKKQLVKLLQEDKKTEKAAADFAMGIPDPRRFGRPEELPKDRLIPWVIQHHLARRAGPHYDVRFGPDDMMSWATKKEMPKPGGKIMLFQQPLHSGSYANFQGELPTGYGAGTVKTHDKGNVVIQEATQDKIKFYVAHKKYPEYYTMIRRSGPPANPATYRTGRTQGGSWLLVNTTPMNVAKILGGKASDVGINKLKYASIPAEKVDKIFDPNYLVQEKIDGASALYHVLGDKINVLSYREGAGGRPLVHTHRVLGLGGAKNYKLPEELEGTILRGEIYGQRDGKVIPPQELGGVLNASVANSSRKQQAQGIKMRNMLFDIVRLGKEPFQGNATERMQKLKELVTYLPKGQFDTPASTNDPVEARKMWEDITSGNNPRTSEGVVAWPMESGKRPIKVKAMPESDVWIKNIFPGEGRLAGTHAGGFEYSNAPEGDIVGRVGTGFSDQTRLDMTQDPDTWLGRMARIRSQGKFPSGAHRAPAFISRHEDEPQIARTM